jgi:hypothetical protein
MDIGFLNFTHRIQNSKMKVQHKTLGGCRNCFYQEFGEDMALLDKTSFSQFAVP